MNGTERTEVPVPDVRVGDVIAWAGHDVEVLDIAERSNGRRFQIVHDHRIHRVHYFNHEHVTCVRGPA